MPLDSMNSTVLADYGQAPVQLLLNAKLNVRSGASRASALVRRAEPGQTLVADQLVNGIPFNGNPRWYREAGTGCYFWSGACTPLAAATPAPAVAASLQVYRRPDGTIRPLDVAGIAECYGKISYTEGPGGSIVITNDWEQKFLEPLQHALLEQVGQRHLRAHRLAVPHFLAAFDAIARDGLGGRLLSCGGTFVPRHISHKPEKPLSSHSWGIAIDLNVAWNGYGNPPQPPGMVGSVYELVPHFAAEGFAWGGHFSGDSRDGMHFELAIHA
jgi:hypothetical protein